MDSRDERTGASVTETQVSIGTTNDLKKNPSTVDDDVLHCGGGNSLTDETQVSTNTTKDVKKNQCNVEGDVSCSGNGYSLTDIASGAHSKHNDAHGANDNDKVRKKPCAFVLGDVTRQTVVNRDVMSPTDQTQDDVCPKEPTQNVVSPADPAQNAVNPTEQIQEVCETEVFEGWNPNLATDDESYAESTDWADDIISEPTSEDQEAYNLAIADLGGGGYNESTGDMLQVADRSTAQSSCAYPRKITSSGSAKTDLKVTVYQDKQSVCTYQRSVSCSEMDRGDSIDPSYRRASLGESGYGYRTREGYTGKPESELDSQEYSSRRSSASYDMDERGDKQYSIHKDPPEERHVSTMPADWYDEKIGSMLVRHTYAGPIPSIKSSVPHGAKGRGRGVKKSTSTVSQGGSMNSTPGCALCGSYQHLTRECQTVKLYAPRLYKERVEKPVEDMKGMQHPKQESQFGKNMYCSHCGRFGHISHECPEREVRHYNFFKQGYID